ncbi:unnamed protein product [Clonostachys rosea]|uniref:Glucose-methanol-choline oxidoreductase C-terminal domain-containing protein n=1 Tax=Bionectria ochroleuca TaxID=29856 RepID=A0ABY6V222_BIOOC|nr:unnamed protein product [Clonostachys rosea]
MFCALVTRREVRVLDHFIFCAGITAAPIRNASLEAAIRATINVNLPDGGSVLGLPPFNVESFRGITFSQPPVNELRLKPPERYSSIMNNLMPLESPPPIRRC